MKRLISFIFSLVFVSLVFLVLSCSNEAPVSPVSNNNSVTGQKLFKPGDIPCAVPVVSVSVTGNSVTVTWGAVTGAANYNVVFAGSPTAIPAAANYTGTSLTRSDIADGSYSVQVKANGGTNYSNSGFCDWVSFTISTTVTKTTPIITWSNPADITYGILLSSTQLNATASVSGTFVYTPVAGTLLNAGTHTLSVAFTPENTASYNNASATVYINVLKAKLATPVVIASVSYTDPSASVSASPAFIWPPNNKMTSVTFSGTVGTGSGTVTFSWNPVDYAGSYSVNGTSQTGTTFTTSALGTTTITVVAVPSDAANYENSDASTAVSATINAGSASYQLVDEYGEFSYSGSLIGSYSIPLSLRATRLGTDMDGRFYTFTITATNGGGTSVNATAISNVPHDQRK